MGYTDDTNEKKQRIIVGGLHGRGDNEIHYLPHLPCHLARTERFLHSPSSEQMVVGHGCSHRIEGKSTCLTGV